MDIEQRAVALGCNNLCRCPTHTLVLAEGESEPLVRCERRQLSLPLPTMPSSAKTLMASLRAGIEAREPELLGAFRQRSFIEQGLFSLIKRHVLFVTRRGRMLNI